MSMRAFVQSRCTVRTVTPSSAAASASEVHRKSAAQPSAPAESRARRGGQGQRRLRGASQVRRRRRWRCRRVRPASGRPRASQLREPARGPQESGAWRPTRRRENVPRRAKHRATQSRASGTPRGRAPSSRASRSRRAVRRVRSGACAQWREARDRRIPLARRAWMSCSADDFVFPNRDGPDRRKSRDSGGERAMPQRKLQPGRIMRRVTCSSFALATAFSVLAVSTHTLRLQRSTSRKSNGEAFPHRTPLLDLLSSTWTRSPARRRWCIASHRTRRRRVTGTRRVRARGPQGSRRFGTREPPRGARSVSAVSASCLPARRFACARVRWRRSCSRPWMAGSTSTSCQRSSVAPCPRALPEPHERSRSSSRKSRGPASDKGQPSSHFDPSCRFDVGHDADVVSASTQRHVALPLAYPQRSQLHRTGCRGNATLGYGRTGVADVGGFSFVPKRVGHQISTGSTKTLVFSSLDGRFDFHAVEEAQCR